MIKSQMFIFISFIQNIQFTTNLRRMILMQINCMDNKDNNKLSVFRFFFLSETRSHASYSDTCITVFSGG